MVSFKAKVGPTNKASQILSTLNELRAVQTIQDIPKLKKF